MLGFCRQHNHLDDYEPYFEKWTEEEMANIGLTLCHITDRMLSTHLAKLEKTYVNEGGIKERMHAARTGYRQAEMAELQHLREENHRLRALLKKHGIEAEDL